MKKNKIAEKNIKAQNAIADPATTGQIKNIQQMWDATIAYFVDGEDDTTSMYNVYQRMSAKLTFQDIANVFSGVYADTYWSPSLLQMDYTDLSKSMQSALALSQPLADQYSQNAIAQWRGILVRCDIYDSGAIPKTGDLYSSIDIVCNNNTMIPPQALIQNWNSQYWQTPQVGKNYVYTRCQNREFFGDLSDATTTPIMPVVNMFYTNGGLNQPPTSWVQLFTANDPTNVNGEVVLSTGMPGTMPDAARGVSEAFLFEPTSSDHVCLLGILTTDYFSKSLNFTTGNWNYTTWITYNGAAGWHNVDPHQLIEEKLVFYNQDGTTENFAFVVNCRNVPVGSRIGLKSTDKAVSFDSGLITINNPSQDFEIPVTLPGNYKGQLHIIMQGPDGGLLPENAAVSIGMVWRLRKGHKKYAEAVVRLRAFNSYKNNEDVDIKVGNFTFQGVEKA